MKRKILWKLKNKNPQLKRHWFIKKSCYYTDSMKKQDLVLIWLKKDKGTIQNSFQLKISFQTITQAQHECVVV